MWVDLDCKCWGGGGVVSGDTQREERRGRPDIHYKTPPDGDLYSGPWLVPDCSHA